MNHPPDQEGAPRELPSHPEADDATPNSEPGTTLSWGALAVFALLAALLAVIVILHLTGVVGPSAH